MTKETVLFVYGTLKKGYSNHHYMLGTERLGEAVTCSNFRMVQIGFPIIYEDGDGHKVKGELYRVAADRMVHIDRLEGGYTRCKVQVTLKSGGPVDAEIYVGRHDYRGAFRIKPDDHGELVWTPNAGYPDTSPEEDDYDADGIEDEPQDVRHGHHGEQHD